MIFTTLALLFMIYGIIEICSVANTKNSLESGYQSFTRMLIVGIIVIILVAISMPIGSNLCNADIDRNLKAGTEYVESSHLYELSQIGAGKSGEAIYLNYNKDTNKYTYCYNYGTGYKYESISEKQVIIKPLDIDNDVPHIVVKTVAPKNKFLRVAFKNYPYTDTIYEIYIVDEYIG